MTQFHYNACAQPPPPHSDVACELYIQHIVILYYSGEAKPHIYMTLQAFGTFETSLLLDAFNTVGAEVLSQIKQMHWDGKYPKLHACFDMFLHRTQPVFKYRTLKNVPAKGQWKVDVVGISYSLVDIGSLSPSVPRHAWVNSAIRCLHDAYHTQNTTVLKRAQTAWGISDNNSKRLMGATSTHPAANIGFTFDPTTYRDAFHHQTHDSRLAKILRKSMMQSVWLQMLGHGGACGAKGGDDMHRSCDLNGHWTINDLNTLDTNDVPMLICNKWTCIASSSQNSDTVAKAKPENKPDADVALDIGDLLISSGWAYKTETNVPDSSRQIFDWYKFLYEHFHLKWFTLEYKHNRARRVQLFSAPNRENEIAVINRANTSLIILACVFNVVFLAYLILDTYK